MFNDLPALPKSLMTAQFDRLPCPYTLEKEKGKSTKQLFVIWRIRDFQIEFLQFNKSLQLNEINRSPKIALFISLNTDFKLITNPNNWIKTNKKNIYFDDNNTLVLLNFNPYNIMPNINQSLNIVTHKNMLRYLIIYFKVTSLISYTISWKSIAQIYHSSM